ncbi:MAG TPA: ParB/Srx family N-terminal domain-containing protein [Mycobacterium sp.]|uniref:ParB/Srx family N-terminal domain-containing protein n=1 Tax=Mycobacterium sp. TaxID=1785 RepID=UPI002F42F932
MTTTVGGVNVALAAKVLRSLAAGRTHRFVAADCHIAVDLVETIEEFYCSETDDDSVVLEQTIVDLERTVALGHGQQLVDFDLTGEDEQRSEAVAARACRSCGCTDAAACPGGCCWVEPDLCSACVPVVADLPVDVAPIRDMRNAIPVTPDPAETRPAPFVRAVPCSLLFVDHSYQRAADERRLRKMIAEFDETRLGVLEVSDRGDGKYAVVEGQHRWLAARDAMATDTAPDPYLVCQVHRGLDLQAEAALFYEIDRGRKPLSGWDRWKARVASGDENAVAIEATVAAFGFKIDPAPRDGSIGATGALERIVDLGDLKLLADTLSLITSSYGKARDGVDGHLLHGLALVLWNYDLDIELSTDKLVMAMQSTPPRNIKARATSLKEGHRAELPRLVAAVIVDRYNAQPGRGVEPLLERLPASSRIGGPGGRKTAELNRIRRWAARHGFPARGHDGGIPTQTLTAYKQGDSGRAAGSGRPMEGGRS